MLCQIAEDKTELLSLYHQPTNPSNPVVVVITHKSTAIAQSSNSDTQTMGISNPLFPCIFTC